MRAVPALAALAALAALERLFKDPATTTDPAAAPLDQAAEGHRLGGAGPGRRKRPRPPDHDGPICRRPAIARMKSSSVTPGRMAPAS
jgi:hypothetical protein